MAVTADSNVGFKGTVDTAQWAKVASLGVRYAVMGGPDLKVTAGGSGDRAVTVAAGEAWGDGVLSTFDTSTNLNGTAVSSGSRWDTLVVRRTWQPALTPTGLAQLVILPGSASKAIASGRTTDAGATTSDQPIALLRFAAGYTVVQEVVDLRVWAGAGGGLVAANTDALLYLTDVGTVVSVGSDRWVRSLDAGGNAVWVATTPAWTEYTRPAGWTASPRPATRIAGGEVQLRGAHMLRISGESLAVAAGVSVRFGSIPTAHAPAADVWLPSFVRYGSGTAAAAGVVIVRTDGGLDFLAAVAGTLSGGDSSSSFVVPPARWDAP